jgi:hypothetical protein
VEKIGKSRNIADSQIHVIEFQHSLISIAGFGEARTTATIGAANLLEARLVNDHDFRSTAVGMAIPYGLYDPTVNCGSVFVDVSHDTPEFAVESISRWWSTEGCRRYPAARKLLILADGAAATDRLVVSGKNESRARSVTDTESP